MRKLCLFGAILFSCFNIFAQPLKPGIAVGSPAPRIQGVIKWIKGNPITEFKKGQIYVVEFGATWCGPCVASIPVLAALADKYRNDIIVQSCFVMEANLDPPGTKNPRYVKRVEEFVAARNGQMRYNVAVDGPEKTLAKTWTEQSGINGIPQIFVIDRVGKVAWIGTNPQPLDSVIEMVRKNNYATKVPSILRSIVVDSLDQARPIYRSEVSWFTGKEKENENSPFVDNYFWARSQEWKERQGTIMQRGENLRRLYYLAYADTMWNAPRQRQLSTGSFPDTIMHPEARRCYGRMWYKPLIHTTDSAFFGGDDYSTTQNRFNYMLIVPRQMGSAKYMQEKMRQDLRNYFGYTVTVERKEMPCWLLTASKEARSKLATKTPGQKWRKSRDENGDYVTQNAVVADLISNLDSRYGYSPHFHLIEHPEMQPPFFDATGIVGEIDFKTDHKKIDQINSRKYDAGTFEKFREVLKEIGIELIKGRKVMNVIIITDGDSRQALKN